MSGTFFSLVPYKKILSPDNRDDSLLTFSIDHYITSKGKRNKKEAAVLTNLMNNILVFNQHYFDRYLRPKKEIKYNYFPNYRQKNREKQSARYHIGGTLTD